jgi:hypothetical protein
MSGEFLADFIGPDSCGRYKKQIYSLLPLTARPHAQNT